MHVSPRNRRAKKRAPCTWGASSTFLPRRAVHELFVRDTCAGQCAVLELRVVSADSDRFTRSIERTVGPQVLYFRIGRRTSRYCRWMWPNAAISRTRTLVGVRFKSLMSLKEIHLVLVYSWH